MNWITPAIYFGTVTHKRLRPVPHDLAYDVASLLVNVQDLGKHMPSLLRYNRPGIFSIHDRDHGTSVGQSIHDFVWHTIRQQPGAPVVTDVFMLCYPRILGYGFNPLTVYYCVDADSQVRLVIYEVHNTFGGRHAYVSDVLEPGGEAYSRAEKVMRVSPFNRIEGSYRLRASVPTDTVAIGVSLTTGEGPLLKAYFSGRRKPLNNGQLLRIFFGLPLMSLKVIAAIHWEALKLWKKGIKLQN